MEPAYIDIYCERTGPGFWAEPVNAATNLAFIVAAVLLARLLLRSTVRRDVACWTLVSLIFVIGVGSFLFHTLAVRWTMLADVVPILLFILFYTWYALRRFAGARVMACWLGLAIVAGIAVSVPPLTGYRAGGYVAALAALVGIGGFLSLRRGHPAGRSLLLAAAVFAVSLGFRTVDEAVCRAIPVGTHFVWHVLNAVVLYVVTRAMILYGRRRAPGPDGWADRP